MSSKKLAIILILVIAASGLTILVGYNLVFLTALTQPPFRYVFLALVGITAVWRLYLLHRKSDD